MRLIIFILQFAILIYNYSANAGIKSFYGSDVVMSTAAVGKSTVADSKTVFEILSTTKGAISCPKMTTTQRDNISSPTSGSCIYNTTTNTINTYSGSAWVAYIKDPTIAVGDILYRSSSGEIDRKAPGTSGQYILTGGPGAGPTYSNGPSSVTVQRFTSGSGTYTTPAGAKTIKVTLIGGGGGGAGSSTSAANAGDGAKGDTSTFGSVGYVEGGTGGTHNAGGVSTGGISVVSSPAITIVSQTGQSGGGAGSTASATTVSGGRGGDSCLVVGGGSSSGNVQGQAGLANTGGGGGGAGTPGTAGNIYGAGGGGGGCAIFYVNSPSATYAYKVGNGSTAGSAGTSGYVGGTGGSGIIIVEEFY